MKKLCILLSIFSLFIIASNSAMAKDCCATSSVFDCQCGDTVVGSCTMDRSLSNCNEGLKVKSAVLNCNFKTISGNMTGSMINKTGIGVEFFPGYTLGVKNCNIKNFQYGIVADDYSGNIAIQGNSVFNNTYGMYITDHSVRNHVVRNRIYNNKYGFFNAGDHSFFYGNKIYNNGFYGSYEMGAINNSKWNNSYSNSGINAYETNDSIKGRWNLTAYIIRNTDNDGNVVANWCTVNSKVGDTVTCGFFGAPTIYTCIINSLTNTVTSCKDASNRNLAGLFPATQYLKQGNLWSDFSLNLGYPYYYYIPGPGNGIDYNPVGYQVMVDTDGDHIPDLQDNCPNSSNADQKDVDLDHVGDVCDNCMYVNNTDQIDLNHNNIGDACENQWVLHLASMPFYTKENANYSGAAVAQMIINYIRIPVGKAPLTVSQDDTYVYAKNYVLPENAFIGDLDPRGMDYVLGHFDPYDTTDTTGGGDPYTAYNYDVEAYSAKNPDAMTQYMRDILHWISYNVTISYFNATATLTPNTPAALPLYGSYNHWVVVNGGVASENPCPYPRTDPWHNVNFTVYGFWLTDPATNGIGSHAFVTAQEAASTYFKPVISNDKYNNSYVQLAEPPVNNGWGKATIANSISNVETKNLNEIVGDDVAVMELAMQENQADFVSSSKEKTSKTSKKDKLAQFKKMDWKKVIDPALLSDASFTAAFQKTRAGAPIKVYRIDTGKYYSIIPFEKNGGVTVTVALDGKDAHFEAASWVKKPMKYLPVGKKQALSLVTKTLPKNQKNVNLTAELVWQPNTYSATPFKPYWLIKGKSIEFVVTQDGEIINLGLTTDRSLPSPGMQR
jgi:parallel beta-helix repeat protein